MDENDTTEEKKVVVTKNAPIRDFDVDNELVTYVKADGVANTRNGIVFTVPATDEDAKDRYNCDLSFLIRAGVRNLSHHVTYAGDHEAMQTAADAYKVGARKTGTGRKTIKKVENERDAAMAVALQIGEENDMTVEAIEAMIADYDATAE